MNKIGKTQIKTEKNSHTFSIKNSVIKEACVTLLETEGVYVKNSGEILTIENAELKTLPTYLRYKNNLIEYQDVCKLVRDIIYLEKKLENENTCIVYFNLEDIVVINNKVFLFLNDSKVSVIKEGNLKITFPIDKNEEFLYPEITQSNSLPMIIPYKASYYSLGLLVLRLLLPEKKDALLFYEKIREMLYPTALYWFLISVLNFDLEKRELIML